MTENEAVEKWKEVYNQTDSIYKSNELDDMFKMAIKALELMQELTKRNMKIKDIENYMVFEDECVKKNFTLKNLLETKEKYQWIPVEEKLPEQNKYILLSFDNFSIPQVGRYEEDEEGNGAFYLGDEEETCISQLLFVNAWMELPEQYKEEEQ